MTDFLPPLRPDDRRTVLGVILLAIILSSLPYLTGWLQARRTDTVYRALSPTATADTNVYYSYIEQARQGRLLLANSFTTQAQTPRLLHPLWLTLGWLAALTQLSVVVVYQLARLVAIGLFLWFVARSLPLVLPEPGWRRVGLLLIAFGSGIGGHLLVLSGWGVASPLGGSTSVDLWISESNTFLSFLHSPLFVLSQLALFLTIVLFFDHPQRSRWWLGLGLIVLLSFAHTYDLLILGLALIAYLVAQVLTNLVREPVVVRQFVWRLSRYLWPSVFGIGYFLWVVAHEPAVRGWIEQNVTISPSPLYYLTGYGFLLVFGVIGAGAVTRDRNRFGLLCLAWFVAAIILSFIPGLQIQRRLINGAHLPLAILATGGLRELFVFLAAHRQRWRQGLRRLGLTAGLAIGFAGTTLAVVLGSSADLLRPIDTYFPRYLPRDFIRAAEWLKETTRPDDGLFSSIWYSNYLAGLTGRPVFIGHGHQTPDWHRAKEQYLNLLTNRLTLDEEAAFFSRARIRFLVVLAGDPHFSQFQADTRPDLQLAFRSGSVSVYRVVGRLTEPSVTSGP